MKLPLSLALFSSSLSIFIQVQEPVGWTAVEDKIKVGGKAEGAEVGGSRGRGVRGCTHARQSIPFFTDAITGICVRVSKRATSPFPLSLHLLLSLSKRDVDWLFSFSWYSLLVCVCVCALAAGQKKKEKYVHGISFSLSVYDRTLSTSIRSLPPSLSLSSLSLRSLSYLVLRLPLTIFILHCLSYLTSQDSGSVVVVVLLLCVFTFISFGKTTMSSGESLFRQVCSSFRDLTSKPD